MEHVTLAQYVETNADNLDWSGISRLKNFTELDIEFVKKFRSEWDWSAISKNFVLSEEFLDEFSENIYWNVLLYHNQLSENFLRRHKENIDWNSVSMEWTIMPESFMREFQEEVNWVTISQRQIMSEDFIREFRSQVYWPHISEFQKLSEEFIRKFKDKLNLFSCFYNNRNSLSTEFIQEMEEYKKSKDQTMYADFYSSKFDLH